MKKEQIIEALKTMTLSEINELVKAVETEFGVSAAVVAAPAAASGDAAPAAASEVAVHIKNAGGNKVAVIKIVREITGLGLMEAKNLVDKAPALIKDKVKKAEADEMAAKLKEAGAEVEFK